MAKIPFDVKYRPQIESGEYKVETFSGYPVTIYRWDFKDKDNTPIMGSYVFEDGAEYCGDWTNEGRFDVLGEPDSFDLFIITPEPELTNWQTFISACLQKHGLLDCGAADRIAQNCSAELLELARKQLIKEQYTSDPRETNLYKLGKAEALKDLPRWEKYPHNAGSEPLVNGILQKDGSYKWRLYLDGYKIEISDLEKLPKEE